MRTGILAALAGGLIGLLGAFAWPTVRVDETEQVLRAFQLATGLGFMALGLVATALAAWGIARRRGAEGPWLAALGGAQLLALAFTYAWVWPLAGLEAPTLVTLDLGFQAGLCGALLVFFGGLVTWASPPIYGEHDRLPRVSLVWNGAVVEDRVLHRRAPLIIGEAQGADITLRLGGLGLHTLLEPRGDTGWRLILPAGADAALQLEGEQRTEKDGTVWDLGHDDFGVLRFDPDLQVVFGFITPVTDNEVRFGTALDPALMASLGSVGSAALVLVAVALLQAKDRKRDRFHEALAAREDVSITMVLNDPPPAPEREPKADGLKADVKISKKAGGEEGTMGTPGANPARKTRVPRNPGALVDRFDPKTMGVAGVLDRAKLGNTALSIVLDGNTTTLGSKLQVAFNGPGGDLRMGPGSGGVGFNHLGKGGGGPGTFGTIQGTSPGDLDTGTGEGARRTIDVGRKPTRRAKLTEIVPPSTNGGCDKANLQSVVRGRASTVRACYESALLRAPDLTGKLTMQWTIDSDGTVVSERTIEDTVRDAGVASCVTRALHRMRFDPPSAGQCVVRWPFVFSAR